MHTHAHTRSYAHAYTHAYACVHANTRTHACAPNEQSDSDATSTRQEAFSREPSIASSQSDKHHIRAEGDSAKSNVDALSVRTASSSARSAVNSALEEGVQGEEVDIEGRMGNLEKREKEVSKREGIVEVREKEVQAEKKRIRDREEKEEIGLKRRREELDEREATMNVSHSSCIDCVLRAVRVRKEWKDTGLKHMEGNSIGTPLLLSVTCIE